MAADAHAELVTVLRSILAGTEDTLTALRDFSQTMIRRGESLDLASMQQLVRILDDGIEKTKAARAESERWLQLAAAAAGPPARVM